MKLIVLGLAALLGASGVALAQPLFSPSQDPLAGERVFAAKGCLTCHAVRGVGGTVGPDLGRTPGPRSFHDLAAALWNHAPKMAARMRQLGIAGPRLEPRESGDLAAYLFTVRYFDPAGRVDVGRRLFTDKRCVVCHRVGDTGGAIGPPLDRLKVSTSPIDVAAAMWNHGPRMRERMEALKVERPTFTGTELVDLIAYVNAASAPRSPGSLHVLPGRAEVGRRLFAEKRCVACHGGDGAEAPPGARLAEREANLSLTQFAAAMWNKAPLMTQAMESRLGAVPTLAPEDMADIVAYLYAVRYFARAGDPRHGVRLAVDKGCLGCHGLYGERGKPASDLTVAASIQTASGVLAALWNHAFFDDPRSGREQMPWPTFQGDEMADLVAYLRSLKGPR